MTIRSPGHLVTGIEAQRKRDRFRLQRVAVGILGESWQVSNCIWHPYAGDFDGKEGGISINRTVNPDGTCGRSFYGGLMTCGSVWTCPVCSLKIAAKRLEELTAVIREWDRRGGHFCMATMTIQHRPVDRAETLLSDLKTALEYQRRGAAHKRFAKRFGWRGHVRVVETMISRAAGFHFHIHEGLFFDEAPDLDDLQAVYMGRYAAKLEELGYHTVDDVTVNIVSGQEAMAQYLTKFALELTTGQAKDGRAPGRFSSFQLLAKYEESGDEWYARKFREYAEATKGRNWFTWSRVNVDGRSMSFYQWVMGSVESSDDEAADEETDNVETLYTLSKDEWYRLREKNLRASALAVADEDASRLRQWLIDQGIITPDPVDWLRAMVGWALSEAEAARCRRAILHHELGDSYAIDRADWGWSGAVRGPLVLASTQPPDRDLGLSGDGSDRGLAVAQMSLIER